MSSRSSVPFHPLVSTAAGALFVTALLAVTPATAIGQQEAPARPAANPADVESPSAVLEALVASVSSEAGERPEWDRYRSLFLPEARIIPTGRDSVDESLYWAWTVRQVVENADTEERIEEHGGERLIHKEIDR